MHGHLLTKVARLTWSLMARPGDMPRYMRMGPFCRRSPLELGLPWFSFAAIDFLERYVTPEMQVFEYGSGGSTLFFAGRTKAVVATEHNEKWAASVEQAARKLGWQNVTVQLRAFDFQHADCFETSAYLNSIPHLDFDIIVVDGGNIDQFRPVCFQHAEEHIRPGSIIVVDDAWNYPDLRKRARSKSCQVFESTGPCRPGVTSTAVFFY